MEHFIEKRILYEDNHLLIINKWPSEIVQGDKTGDIPLSETLKGYIKEKYAKPGNVFLGVTHRIDRPVSGAVIFAKTSKALSRINQMFQKNEIQKKYWAIIADKPENKTDTLTHYLIKNSNKNKTYAYNTPKPNSKIAKLTYSIIYELENYYVLDVELHTGRPHQIRSQLSAIGCPIKGDIKYGAQRTNDNKSIHLHARYIKFVHPVQNVPIEIIAKPPKDTLWQIIEENI